MLGYRSLYITWQQHHNCRIVCELSLRILICILPKFYTHSLEGAQSPIHSLPEIKLNINFKAQHRLNRKTKTDTNPIPDPNRYRRRCPARIQKFYTFIGTPEKSLHRVTIRNEWVGVGHIDGLKRRPNCLISNHIADKLSGPWSETWGLGGVNCTYW